jgi:hypothetical protein
MATEWQYYEFRNGKLYDEDGYEVFSEQEFATAADAEAWLVENDIRGTVR